MLIALRLDITIEIRFDSALQSDVHRRHTCLRTVRLLGQEASWIASRGSAASYKRNLTVAMAKEGEDGVLRLGGSGVFASRAIGLS